MISFNWLLNAQYIFFLKVKKNLKIGEREKKASPLHPPDNFGVFFI